MGRSSRRLTPVAAAACAVVLAGTVSAQPTLITDRGNLNAVDAVEWNGFGPSFTTVPSGSVIQSNQGLDVTVSMPAGDFERRNQDDGWAGNFGGLDALLWTATNPGPMVITFSSPVAAAGAQIQRNTYGIFTATIEAYDAGGTMMAAYDVQGDSTNDGDNSAIFVGVQDTSPTIVRIEYSVDDLADDFAVNQLDIGAAGVPTLRPLSLILLALLLIVVSVFAVVRRG